MEINTTCLALLDPDDVRAKFELDFLRFAEAMDMVLPDPKGLEEPYVSDLKWLARLRVIARRAHYQEPFDPKDYGAKVGEIIAKHLSVDGIEQLLAKRDILDPSFRQHLDSLTSSEAKAAEIEHAIRHEIHVHRDENPAAYTSLWEQLETIINRRREGRIAAASALEQLANLAAQVPGARSGRTGSGSGLTGTAGRIFPFVAELLPKDAGASAASEIATALEGYASFVDWQYKEDVQRQMRRSIKERLRSSGADAAKIEAATAKVMDVARRNLAK